MSLIRRKRYQIDRNIKKRPMANSEIMEKNKLRKFIEFKIV